jgi:uncharacterized secreted protein with C-terminal beta-propeller domain
MSDYIKINGQYIYASRNNYAYLDIEEENDIFDKIIKECNLDKILNYINRLDKKLYI